MSNPERVLKRIGNCTLCGYADPVYFLPGQEQREICCPACRMPLTFSSTVITEAWRARDWTFLRIVRKVRPVDYAIFLRREELLANFPLWERKSLNLPPSKTASGLVEVKRFHCVCHHCGKDNRMFFLTDFSVTRATCESCGHRLTNPTVTRKTAGLAPKGVCCLVDKRPLSPVIVDKPSDLSVMSRDDLEILGLL